MHDLNRRNGATDLLDQATHVSNRAGATRYKRRRGQHEASAAMRGGDLRGHLAQHGQRARDLLSAAPRQHTDDEVVVAKTEPPARGLARGRALEGVEHGVADELHGHAGLPIERDLEGKRGEHARHPPADQAHAPRAPRPDLGRHEVRHRDAGPARHAGQTQVELREVDEHERRRPRRPRQRGLRAPPRRQQRGDRPQRLGAADGRRRRDVGQALEPGRGHAVAAHADQPTRGRQRAQRPAERGAVQVAGGLAGDHHDGRVLRRRHPRSPGPGPPRSRAARSRGDRGSARGRPPPPASRRRRPPRPPRCRGRCRGRRSGSRARP